VLLQLRASHQSWGSSAAQSGAPVALAGASPAALPRPTSFLCRLLELSDYTQKIDRGKAWALLELSDYTQKIDRLGL
jgi:hypothetical protein